MSPFPPLELLSPAGSLEKLKFAVEYGADAVYAGAPAFSLRNKADQFTLDEFGQGLAYVHARGKKLFLAANMFFHDEDLAPFEAYLAEAVPLGFDGLILSDLGMIDFVRQTYPDLDVHVSTQANTTNKAAARTYAKLGVKRLVLARELSLDEIKAIRDAVDIELEAFVHGAMCIAYSGRCLLSNYFSTELGRKGGPRDANRGDCTQVCRWEFALTEESRPGEYFPVVQDDFGTAILSSRDLNMAGHLADLVAAGVTSFKIEGRMKSAWYAAATTKAYRRALDRAAAGLPPDPSVVSDLQKLSHRGSTTGFYYQKDRSTDAGGELAGYPLRNGTQQQRMVALVDEVGPGFLIGRATNPIRGGTVLETLNPRADGNELRDFTLTVDGEPRQLVRPNERFTLAGESAALGAVGAYSLLLEAAPVTSSK
jgi:putative protease